MIFQIKYNCILSFNKNFAERRDFSSLRSLLKSLDSVNEPHVENEGCFESSLSLLGLVVLPTC